MFIVPSLRFMCGEPNFSIAALAAAPVNPSRFSRLGSHQRIGFLPKDNILERRHSYMINKEKNKLWNLKSDKIFTLENAKPEVSNIQFFFLENQRFCGMLEIVQCPILDMQQAWPAVAYINVLYVRIGKLVLLKTRTLDSCTESLAPQNAKRVSCTSEC